VTIPDSFFIRTDGDRVDALIDCVYNYFNASYCCLEYLAAQLLCAQQMSLLMLSMIGLLLGYLRKAAST
jgi:hypothetical protein